jgi:DNA polymerase-1
VMTAAWGGQLDVAEGVSNSISMLTRTVRELRPEFLVLAFDPDGGSFRKRLSPVYKAHRTTDTTPYVEAMRHAAEERFWCHVTVPDYEADDVLATIAARGNEKGSEVVLLTADSDLDAHVTPRVSVVRPVAGAKPLVVRGQDRVLDDWGLHQPWQIAHHKALTGEKNDGIVGVPGVGDKTASELLRLHEDVYGVLKEARAAVFEGRRTERLGKALYAIDDLAGLVTENLDLTVLQWDVPLPPLDGDRLRVAYA